MGITGALFAYLNQWRRLCNLQLRLDRCVAQTVIRARSMIDQIETTTLEMKALRAAIVAAEIALQVELIPPLQAALQGLYLFQKSIEALWMAEQVGWGLHAGCAQWGDVPLPIKPFPFADLGPDVIGPQPYQLKMGDALEIKVQVIHPPRSSNALTKGTPGALKNSWKSQWTGPG
jgi:hypothetical protein